MGWTFESKKMEWTLESKKMGPSIVTKKKKKTYIVSHLLTEKGHEEGVSNTDVVVEIPATVERCHE